MKKIFILIIPIFIFSCNQQENISPSTRNNTEWIIPQDQIFDGGPGKDGIPALLNPEMVSASAADYLTNDELIIGFKSGSDVRAYPHDILDWHEIINDEVEGRPIAITYCPLTGTGIGWEREINGEVTTYGVSGLLYNSNLIPYDRLTDSNWSQMLLESVNGPLAEREAQTFQVIETTWGTWKSWYPDTKVNSTNTGFTRNYGRYPYGNYKTSESLIFPVNNNDDRLHAKERILGVKSENTTRAYRLEDYTSGPKLIEDEIDGKKLVVVGSKVDNYIFSFYCETEDGESVNLSLNVDNNKPLLQDETGNIYNIFGEAIDGPEIGKKLKKTESYIGFWFAWAAFYPQIQIFDSDSN